MSMPTTVWNASWVRPRITVVEVEHQRIAFGGDAFCQGGGIAKVLTYALALIGRGGLRRVYEQPYAHGVPVGTVAEVVEGFHLGVVSAMSEVSHSVFLIGRKEGDVAAYIFLLGTGTSAEGCKRK